MIRASTLLTALPLPAASTSILKELVGRLSDPELHIPGLPSLPMSGVIPEATKEAVMAVLSKFDFEFYQTVGVRVSVGGANLGGIGARLSETVNVNSPKPALKVVPVFDVGAPKE